MPYSARRPGFTLIELTLSVAIMTILTAITFVSLSRSRSRETIRRVAEQMQVDIQGTQVRAQSGRVLPAPLTLCHKVLTNGDPDPNAGKPCLTPNPTVDCGNVASTCVARPPVSYGIRFIVGNNAYRQFADIDLDGAGLINPNRTHDFGYPEDGVQTVLPGMQLRRVLDGAGAEQTRVDLTFDVPTGKLFIVYPNAPGHCVTTPAACQAVSIVVQQLSLNLCYSVTVDAAALGTVNRRVLTSCL